MSIIIELEPETESRLKSEAELQGLSLDEYARQLLENQFTPDRERFMRSFGRWANDSELEAALAQIDRDRHAALIRS